MSDIFDLTVFFNPDILFHEQGATTYSSYSEYGTDAFTLEKILDSGWPWPLDSVQRFFEDLWNFIANIPARVWDWFQDKLRDALRWLWGNIAYPLAQFVWEVYNITYEWTAGWPEPWASIARFFLFPTAFAYKGLRDYVGPALSNAINTVKAYFDGAVGGVFDAIRNAFSPIFDPLKRFAEAVWSFLTETFPGWLKTAADFFVSLPQRLVEFFEWLKTGFFNAINALVDFFTRTVPDWFESLRNFLVEIPERLRRFFFDDLPEAVKTYLKMAWDWLSEHVGKPIMDGLQFIFDKISEAVRGFFKQIVDYYRGLTDAFEAEGAEGVLTRMLPLMAAGLGIAVAVDVASLKIAGSGLDPQAVRQFLDRTVFKLIDVEVFTSVFLAIAVQKPLEYVVKRAFRTERPSPGDALNFLSKNIIDRDRAMYYLQIAGYPDEMAQEYIKSIFREPPFDAVFTAYRRGKIDEREYSVWLRVLNVNVAETLDGVFYPYKVLEEASYRMPSPFLLYALAETGEISEDVLRRLFEYELIHPEFIDVTVKGLMWRGLRDERSLLRRYVIDLFSEGILTITEFESYLGLLGITGDFSKSIIEVAELNREKTLRRKVMSQLERMFLDGYISREGFVERAAGLGYDRELVSKYAALLEYIRDNYYVIKETRDERNAYRSALVNKFKYGYISEEELRSELLKLNLNEIEVELTVMRAKLEYDAEQKEILFKDIIEKLRTGLMTKSDFVDQCTRLGIRYERCTAYADYYWSKYIGEEFYVMTKDERNALASALLKKYVLGFMTPDELRSELLRLRFTPEEVELRIRRAEVEDEVKMLSELVAEADTLLKRGEISADMYVSWLVSLGMREDRAVLRARKILATVKKS